MILPVGIFVNNLFIFSASNLTFFQSWILRDDYQVFFFNSIFIVSSCFNIFFVCGNIIFNILRFNSVKKVLAFHYLVLRYELGYLIQILLSLLVHIFLVSHT